MAKTTPKRRPARWRAPWTLDDDNALRWGWGDVNLPTLARRLGRTTAALANRAKALGLGGYRRGFKSLDALERESGYPRRRLLQAAEALGLELPRTVVTDRPARHPGRRAFCLGPEHEAALLAFLRTRPDGEPVVSRRDPARERERVRRAEATWPPGVGCKGCGTRHRIHCRLGWCTPCYETAAPRVRGPAARRPPPAPTNDRAARAAASERRSTNRR